jgi:glycosyltransferase involved in cell wall biosynthesis
MKAVDLHCPVDSAASSPQPPAPCTTPDERARAERDANPAGGPQPQKTVEVLIPAYNEEHNIGVAIERVFALLRDPRYRIEVIVVDDGSADRTADVVRGCCERYPVTLISLSRNFGKETALLAGLDRACGDATIIMDADLQHPVEVIPLFLAEWEAGYRSVYAVKQNRRGEALGKMLLVRLFYLLVNYGSKVRIEPNAVDFRLLDRSVVAALRSLRERVRFTKGLYAWVGFKSKAVPFVPDPRHEGRSKFDPRSLLRLASDGLTSFSDLPLRLATVVGFVISFGALVYGAWIWIRTLLFGIEVPGWATLIVAETFFSGVQMLFLGILGQYLRNIFLETKGRPSYVLADVVASPLCAAYRDGPAQTATATPREAATATPREAATATAREAPPAVLASVRASTR